MSRPKTNKKWSFRKGWDMLRVANLISFVEEEAEVGEDNPQLLPTVAVLELAQKIATQLVL